VDVAVPDPVAAHDDDGVADAGPHVLEGRDGVVVRLQEVHHLVAEVGDVAVLAALGVAGEGLGEHRPIDLDGFGDRATVGDVEEHVEQQQEAGATGVDHACVLEDREHLGRPLEGIGAPGAGGVQDRDEVGPALGRCHRGLRRLAHHREDRALDRSHDGLVGSLGRRREGSRPTGAVEPVGLGHHPGDPAEDLRQDHTRVSPRPHQGAVADGLADGTEVAVHALQLLPHRGQREGHVRAGVAVGHGVDVELVDALLVGVERVAVPQHHGPQVLGAEARQRRHRPGY
jgi:hypothetical protein